MQEPERKTPQEWRPWPDGRLELEKMVRGGWEWGWGPGMGLGVGWGWVPGLGMGLEQVGRLEEEPWLEREWEEEVMLPL